MTKEYKRICFLGLIIILSIIYIINSFSVKLNVNSGIEGILIPLALGLSLLLTASLDFLRVLKTEHFHDSINMHKYSSQTNVDSPALKRQLETLGLLIVYVILLQYLGFLFMTMVYLLFQSIILVTDKKQEKSKTLFKLIVFSLLSTFVIHYLFVDVFKLILPYGTLFSH